MPQLEWEALEREVRELASRVAQLEAHLGLAEECREASPPEPLDAARFVAPRDMGSFFPIAGRALLGLAGAYLLRSLTENHTISPAAGVGVGILYAIAWLVLAARTTATKRLEAATHSLTAVLILSPLLWEATLKFHAISNWTAAAMLIVFGVFGLAVSWQKDLLIVATIATLAVLGTAVALLLASHDCPPYTTVLLVMAAAVETCACLDHWLSERWLAAGAADLSVLLATWLVTGPHGLPEIYVPIAYSWLIGALVALLMIYFSSTVFRTLLRGFTFTGFEIAQSVVTFAIVLDGALRLSATDPRLAPVIGTLVLAGGGGCYLVSFLKLDGQHASSRNFYTYSTFAIILALAGSRVVFPQNAYILWYVLALASASAGRFSGRMTLAVHAAVFLLLALISSGTAQDSLALLLGPAPGPGIAQPFLWAGAVAAMLAYLVTGTAFQPVRLAMAAAAATVSAGVAAGCLTAAYHSLFGPGANLAYCATLRTTVIAILALVLAWAAMRWEYPEFSRLVYPAMILGAYRLVARDLHEEKIALFLSLLIYGAALTALPRLKKAG